MSFFKKKITQEQDRYITKVAKKFDAPYEKVRERMDYALKKYGVDYKTFVSKDMYILNERRWKNLALRVKKKQESQLEALKKSGIDTKTAADLIDEIKEKTFYEFSIDQLINYGLVFMNIEDAIELAHKLKKRRALVSRIKKQLARGVVSEGASAKFAIGTDAVSSGAFAKEVEQLYELFKETISKARHDELASKADDEDMIIDMEVSNKIFKTSAMEYKLYRFKDIPFVERYEFLANSIKNETLRSLPGDEDGDTFRALCDMVDNKIASYEAFKDYYKRDCLAICQKADYTKFVDFCKRHSRFIKKPLTSSQGKGIEIFESQDNLKDLFDKVRTQKEVILEELVVQNELTAKFNPDSINTFRIITFNDGKEIVPKWGFFRTGRAGSVVDNAGAGGVFAAIDCKTGVLCSDGADEDGNIYPVHPETGIKYQDFELPQWDELSRACIELSSRFKEAAIIGWDFAYTDKEEWVVIEANLMPEFVFQGPTGEGVKKEFFELIEKRKENLQRKMD